MSMFVPSVATGSDEKIAFKNQRNNAADR